MKSIAKSRICKNLQYFFHEVFSWTTVKKLKELKIIACPKKNFSKDGPRWIFF